MNYGRRPLHIAIVSARRPENVPLMEARFSRPQDLHWYVAEGDHDAYAAVAAGQVVEGGSLMDSRNLALEAAQQEELFCAQLSDDLEWIKYSPTKSRADWYDISVMSGLDVMYRSLLEVNARLAGVSPTNNPYFVNHDINPKGFCLGDLMLVHPGSDLRFDDQLRLKEDYDFTLQHLAEHGRVARVDRVLPSFRHYSNTGGAVSYRNDEVEQATIAYLMAKWPGALRPNPKRPNEIIMQWPPKKGSEMWVRHFGG